MRWSIPLFLAPALAFALGDDPCLLFAESHNSFTLFDTSSGSALPLLTDSHDPLAVHIAARTFVQDVYRVTGLIPEIYNDTLPSGTARAILVGTAGSSVIAGDGVRAVRDKWEAWDARVVVSPRNGLKEGLVITGSDKVGPAPMRPMPRLIFQRGTVYALYTLSEQMGVSPFHFWADVPVHKHSVISFPRKRSCGHGSPHVKYRGFFINDEAPVLTNWVKHHFKRPTERANFQTYFYEPLFELLLRLKGNYFWPAMWNEMFHVDGLDVSDGLPGQPIPGPNQVLADEMGIVMGTSHHEPMARNQAEWVNYAKGEWNYTANHRGLSEFWRYGAERAKGKDTLFTVGMRGNGDLPLPGADVEILQSRYTFGYVSDPQTSQLPSSRSCEKHWASAASPVSLKRGRCIRRSWGTLPMA